MESLSSTPDTITLCHEIISDWLRREGAHGDRLEIEVEFETMGKATFGLKVRQGNNEETVIGCDPINNRLFLDRNRAGNTDFHPKFAGTYEAPLRAREGRVLLHVFVDASSVEVFANNGEAALTALILPASVSRGVEFWATSDDSKIRRVDLWKLRSTWR